MRRVFKLLQPAFNILFYVCAFFAALFILLSIILLFVNVDASELLFPPFASEMPDGRYEVWLGAGQRMWADPNEITLEFIKTIIYSKMLVWICGFLTVAPVFKIFSVILKNVNNQDSDKRKNMKLFIYTNLIMWTGMGASMFVWRLYRYYIDRLMRINIFKIDPDIIKFNPGIELSSMLPAMIISLSTLIGLYVGQNSQNSKNNPNSQNSQDNQNGGGSQDTPDKK